MLCFASSPVLAYSGSECEVQTCDSPKSGKANAKAEAKAKKAEAKAQQTDVKAEAKAAAKAEAKARVKQKVCVGEACEAGSNANTVLEKTGLKDKAHPDVKRTLDFFK